jgi:hypothetical protein
MKSNSNLHIEDYESPHLNLDRIDSLEREVSDMRKVDIKIAQIEGLLKALVDGVRTLTERVDKME